MTSPTEFRQPGLNEKRCIVRHGLKFYHGLATAAIYSISGFESELGSAGDSEVVKHLTTPLSTCVQEHPLLSALIDGQSADQARFRRAASIELTSHVKMLKIGQLSAASAKGSEAGAEIEDSEEGLIKKTLEYILNDEFDNVGETPPWRIYLVPLSRSQQIEAKKHERVHPEPQRILIAYCVSHSHGDGSSGLVFHRAFSKALEDTYSPSSTKPSTLIPASDQPLPAAIDFPTHLHISWSYLISALANEFVPKDLLSMFTSSKANSRTTPSSTPSSSSPITPTQPWTGRPCFSLTTNSFPQTAVHSLTVPSDILRKVLSAGRPYQAKLTGILHQIITTAICKVLAHHHGIQLTSLATETPLDLRRPHGTSTNTMGVMASTLSRIIHATPLPSSSAAAVVPPPSTARTTNAASTENPEDRFWHYAKETTQALAKASSTTSDHPIGLLRYISSLRTWHTDKLGKPRGTTYELSNIMAFDVKTERGLDRDESAETKTTVCIEKIAYAQAADVGGPVMTFNVVSVKAGDLVIAVSWQVGAMGFDGSEEMEMKMDRGMGNGIKTEAVEREFVRRVARDVEESFKTLASL